jgi:hypothetical protein
VDERVSARNANTSWREEEEEEEEMMRDANTSRQAMLQAQFDFLCSCAVCQGPERRRKHSLLLISVLLIR